MSDMLSVWKHALSSMIHTFSYVIQKELTNYGYIFLHYNNICFIICCISLIIPNYPNKKVEDYGG